MSAGGARARLDRVAAPRVVLAVAAAVASLAVAISLALGAAPALAGPSPYLSKDRTMIDAYAAVEGAKLGVVLPGGPEHFIALQESPKSSIPSPEGPALGTTNCVDAKGAQGIVRVHNLIAQFSIFGSPGNTEADPKSAQALLASVAKKL